MGGVTGLLKQVQTGQEMAGVLGVCKKKLLEASA